MPISRVDLPPRDERIDRAIEVFARGHAAFRSLTHPYLAEQVGPVWVMRDGPRTSGRLRSEEWIAYRVDPVEVHRIASDGTRGSFGVCAFVDTDEPEEPVRDAYRSLGYRLARTEPLMVRTLGRIARPPSCPAQISRVLDQVLAERLAKAARGRRLLPHHLVDDAPIRQYVACIDDEIVGWVASNVVDDATYCSDMFVVSGHRRRGIATALMSRLLRDDRANGSTLAVLLASHTGAHLYPHVGYEQIGTLLLYTPPRSG